MPPAGNWGVDAPGTALAPGALTPVELLQPEPEEQRRPDPMQAALGNTRPPRTSMHMEDMTDEDLAAQPHHTPTPSAFARRRSVELAEIETGSFESPPLKVKQESRSFAPPRMQHSGVPPSPAGGSGRSGHSSSLDPLPQFDALTGSGNRSQMEDVLDVQMVDEMPPMRQLSPMPSPPAALLVFDEPAVQASHNGQQDIFFAALDAEDQGDPHPGLHKGQTLSGRPNGRTPSGQPHSRRSSTDHTVSAGGSFHYAATALGKSFTKITSALTDDDHVIDKWVTGTVLQMPHNAAGALV